MLGNATYHQIFRKTIIAFGTLFNDIYIHHQYENTEYVSVIKVHIRYGPIQKFLARLEEKPDLRKRQAITLPRMSYEIGKLTYDSSRKTSKMQTFNAVTTGGTPAKLYMPVPYNLPIELSIITKFNDDMFEIIEPLKVPVIGSNQIYKIPIKSKAGLILSLFCELYGRRLSNM